MPRISRGPHLYLKRSANGAQHWYIRDGQRRVATGCDKGDPQGARDALERHIGRSAKPQFGNGDPARVTVAAVIALYGRDVAPKQARPKESVQRLTLLNDYFGSMAVAGINPSTCADYLRWRTHDGPPLLGDPPRRAKAVKPQSVRRELADLQAALGYAWEAHKIPNKIPVSMPPPGAPRERWLTRSEAARLVWSCLGWTMAPATVIKTRQEIWLPFCRREERINRHAARFVLIGLRTGTRHDAILGLGWHQHLQGGWVDLKHGLIYRRPTGQAETNKRRPPVPMADGLWSHMRRWHRLDGKRLFVISWDGERIAKLRRSFASAVRHAGLDQAVTPHVLRHTCATWLVQSGRPLWEVAGFLGMTVEMVESVYGHHNPEHLRGAARALR